MARTPGGLVPEGTLLWEPSEQRIARAGLTRFMRWLADEGGRSFTGYDQLWRWSVDDLEGFWESVRRYFGVGPAEVEGPVLVRGRGAEGASWYPGLHLNYVDAVLGQPGDLPAVIALDESGDRRQLSYAELRAAAGAAAAGLRRLGVGPGDRVAAVVTNGAEAAIGLLAAASLGAVWSSCAPEFGTGGMLDRFRQITPTVLLAVAGYRYGGRVFPMAEKIAALESALPGLRTTVLVPGAGCEGPPRGAVRRLGWEELTGEAAPLEPVPVPFGHPLWILYSSGTTGLPKPIVHGHGGIVLEHLKSLALHCDLQPGERFFWFSTTGWMMWNFLVGGLQLGTTVVAYDGSPRHPDLGELWRMAQRESLTLFGTSAAFVETCRQAGLSPRTEAGPTTIRTLGSTGSPLSPEGFAWAATEIGDNVLVGSISGGTDVCTAFLAPCPLRPVRAGELQCVALGAKVEAFDEEGRSVVGSVGELVVTEPMPSMPLALWGDADGSRLHDSYFAVYPGVWRHGDWVKLNPDGSSVVYGRSDATLNRGGVRMGTAELYRVLDDVPGVADSLVLDTSELGREGELVLLVTPDAGPPDEAQPEPAALGPEVEDEIRRRLRQELSPRHVPDRVVAVPALPRTINGKKIEVPLRRILLGAPVDRAVSASALDRPEALAPVLRALAAAGLLADDPAAPSGGPGGGRSV